MDLLINNVKLKCSVSLTFWSLCQDLTWMWTSKMAWRDGLVRQSWFIRKPGGVQNQWVVSWSTHTQRVSQLACRLSENLVEVLLGSTGLSEAKNGSYTESVNVHETRGI